MENIMSEIKKGEISRVTFTNEQLHRYFPPEYSQEQMEKVIETLLEEWTKRQEG